VNSTAPHPGARTGSAGNQGGGGHEGVSREQAEAELFGRPEVDESAPSGKAGAPVDQADAALRSLAGRQQRAAHASQSYDPAQLEQGDVLNAAVIVKDPRRIAQTIKELRRLAPRPGFPYTPSPGRRLGLVGQFVTMIRAVLYISVLIILLWRW